MREQKATPERLGALSDGVFAVVITIMVLAHQATPQLIWWNFAHLFMVSLVPSATVWVASTRLAAGPVFVYAAVFVMVNVAYLAFVWETLS